MLGTAQRSKWLGLLTGSLLQLRGKNIHLKKFLAVWGWGSIAQLLECLDFVQAALDWKPPALHSTRFSKPYTKDVEVGGSRVENLPQASLGFKRPLKKSKIKQVI